MAYTDDAVKAKLSALNETQESIVTVAQWVMFHRRHADRTGTIWLQKLKEAGASKRLNLIYLANEVAQQSKARKKDDFLIAFSPIIADASAIAYKGATNEVQQKLRRVIEVWRQRQIFETPIQEAIESRIDELDKSRSSGKKPLLGGSLFSNSSGPSAPIEIQPLVPLQIAVSKALASANSATSAADIEYEKHSDPRKANPKPPVYAARLSALLKSLANAEGAVSESIKARQALIGGLEKILETNRIAIAAEEKQLNEYTFRKSIVGAKKLEVEESIMNGLSAEPSPVGNHTPAFEPQVSVNGKSAHEFHNNAPAEPQPPKIEELTPPPIESLTPIGSPPRNTLAEPQTSFTEPAGISSSQPQMNTPAGADLLSSLAIAPVRHYAGIPGGGGPPKKRKLEPDFSDFGGGEDAMAELDQEVAELLRAESMGH